MVFRLQIYTIFRILQNKFSKKQLKVVDLPNATLMDAGEWTVADKP